MINNRQMIKPDEACEVLGVKRTKLMELAKRGIVQRIELGYRTIRYVVPGPDELAARLLESKAG